MMTAISDSADMVALVQASTALPIMLLSLPSGAIADNFDRRKVMLIAQCFMLAVSVGLTIAAYLGVLTPWLLLAFTFLIGCGTALNNPSWQSSVGDMVPRTDLAAAVALNSMGFNLTRSVGPAIGGAIVAAAGAAAAFAVNAASYLALIFVLLRWQPTVPASALPRETIGPAMAAGLRYVAMSPNIGKVLLRGFVFGFTAISILALLPLVARDIIEGGPLLYGVLLGSFGIGAVGGALISGRLRQVLSSEWCVRLAFIGFAALRRSRRPQHLSLADLRRADDRRRQLGDRAVAVQRHRAAVDAALGGRPRAVALPDGDVRRHGAGQLELGPGGGGFWSGQGAACIGRIDDRRARHSG